PRRGAQRDRAASGSDRSRRDPGAPARFAEGRRGAAGLRYPIRHPRALCPVRRFYGVGQDRSSRVRRPRRALRYGGFGVRSAAASAAESPTRGGRRSDGGGVRRVVEAVLSGQTLDYQERLAAAQRRWTASVATNPETNKIGCSARPLTPELRN